MPEARGCVVRRRAVDPDQRHRVASGNERFPPRREEAVLETHARPQQKQAEGGVERAHDATSASLIGEAELANAGREPMGSIGGWMADFGGLGATTGLAMVLTSLALAGAPEQGSLLSFLLMGPLVIGLAGAGAGAVSGLILRALRRQVPPALGVFLAAMGTNMAGSLLTVSAHEVFQSAATEVIVGQAAPLSLAVWALIPLVAVLRWRGQRTLPWLVLFGTIAGVLIGL